ncbi:putative AC9 transposase [Orchesella cincta]|uniref:Putative AC9 transposase n=1 Tax=Orchesella cincta TaxID=48709 RepID=A0A1D2M5Z3_ORCCI|nr:putative AC9 transposase [Orchesella cincta]
MCTETCHKRIKSDFAEKKRILIKRMSGVAVVCLTADIWSARGRSFMGVTAHWLSFDSTATLVDRHSVTLALRRFVGIHSNDKIAEMLQDIMNTFGIDKKVVCVVTDNASNFVKAFICIGRDYATDNGLIWEDHKDFVDLEEDFEKRKIRRIDPRKISGC